MGSEEFYYDDSKKGIGKVMKLFEEKSSFGEDILGQSSSSGDNKGAAVALLEGDIRFEDVWFKYPASKDRLAEINRDSACEDDSEKDQEQQTDINELSDSYNSEDEG